MMKFMRICAALAAPLLLAGCLLSPGKFVSGLDISDNGDFTFRYAGELLITDMSGPEATTAAEFEPFPCYDDKTFEDRDCTETELSEQRADFEASRASNGMPGKMAMPGMPDLNTDEGINELVEMLKKQKGWDSVVHRGDKVLDVEYTISGNLSHGFAFPMADNMPGIFAFVTATPRKNGSVKITAPAFVNNDGASSPMAAMGSMMGATPSNEGVSQKPFASGQFTIRTNGEILTNNTEEGPQATGGMSELVWTITERSAAAPEALIRLAQ